MKTYKLVKRTDQHPLKTVIHNLWISVEIIKYINEFKKINKIKTITTAMIQLIDDGIKNLYKIQKEFNKNEAMYLEKYISLKFYKSVMDHPELKKKKRVQPRLTLETMSKLSQLAKIINNFWPPNLPLMVNFTLLLGIIHNSK